jgi:hypothetical protein
VTSNVDRAVLGGRVIGSYSTYEEAQRVVDTLSDRQFPVEHVTIVGRDVRILEKVVGRLTTARAALAGLATGAWIGLFIGLVFWIVTPWFVGPMVSSVLIGALFGAAWGAGAHAMTRGRRDFASLRLLDAAAYDITVDEDHAEEALRLLPAELKAH